MWIREGHGGTRNLSQCGSNEQGVNQRFKGIFRPQSEVQAVFPAENRWSPKKKKIRLHWNCKGFFGQIRKFKRFFWLKTGDLQKKKRCSSQKRHDIRCQSTKNTNLGLDLYSSSPEPVNFFGAQSSFGGAQFWGGTAPVCPPVAPGLICYSIIIKFIVSVERLLSLISVVRAAERKGGRGYNDPEAHGL